MIKFKNFSLDALPSSIENGEVFEFCNFTQAIAGTDIFSGATGLTFRNCNLINCVVPVGSIIEKCNNTQKSFCSHLHTNWGLVACIDDCEHVYNSDEIWVDGVLIETTYYYEDIAL